MITLKEFMELVDYRITEGSDYMWSCYGPNAHRLDSWNGDHDGHSVSIIFDTQSQNVYEVTAYDYQRNRAYRLINPDYIAAHKEEAQSRDVDFNQAWDEVNYIDLEVDDDFIQKALAIVANEDYDTRIMVPIELEDDIMFEVMKIAHERDITFNQLVEEIIKEACNNTKSFTDFFQETQKPAKGKSNKKAKRRDLAFELMGVITDYDETGVFDEVSFETVKRVCNQLSTG